MKRPELALLTSFCFGGLREAAGLLPELDSLLPHAPVRNIELYIAMQGDVDGDLKRFHRPPPGPSKPHPNNALHLLAQEQDHKGLAEWLSEIFVDRKIVAISTFLPEIMSHHAAASEAAEKSLKNLVHLAAELRRQGHPIRTVELVGGSLVDGLWLWENQPNPEVSTSSKDAERNVQFAVNRLGFEAGLGRLIERLIPVADEALKGKIVLSLEMEPGILFAAGGLEALRFLADALETQPEKDKNDALRRVLGFNLDLPHWAFLERIDVALLRREPAILKRIAHAHGCDHWIGHVADSRTRVFHSELHFKEWLRLLGEINATPDEKRLIPFSGYFTCELECVSDLATVAETLNDLDSMLDRWCGPAE